MTDADLGGDPPCWAHLFDDDEDDDNHVKPTVGLSTAITEMFGIRHPILLAPMGDSAGGRLAAAVSNAGALGLIGGGYADPHWLEAEINNAAGASIGIGFITFALDKRPDTLTVALDSNPVAIQLSFGDPRPYVDSIRQSGARLICQVQSPDELALALEAGADVIIAQGQDAGGHGRPDRALMGLVPSVVDEVGDTPVVAAGGIADGRGLAAALMLGAAGISLGTRLLASREALTTEAEAALLVSGRSHETVRTEVFDTIRGPGWPTGYDGRAIRNRLVDEWDAGAGKPRLHAMYAEATSGDYTLKPVWAGEGLDLIRSIEPAATIIDVIIAEAVERLGQASDLLA